MTKKDGEKFLYLLLGAVVIEIILKKTSASGGSSGSTSGANSSGGLFSTLTQGLTNMVSSFTGKTAADFVAAMTPIASQIQAAYGIDPLITMTQSALESRWGRSGLTQQANNLFGMTAGSWLSKGLPVIDMPTHEYSSKQPDQISYFETPGDLISKALRQDGGSDLMVHRYFRKYPTWYDSAADWAKLLSTLSVYSTAYADAQAGDLASFSNDIAAAGYATEPDYAVQLVAAGTEIQGIQSA